MCLSWDLYLWVRRLEGTDGSCYPKLVLLAGGYEKMVFCMFHEDCFIFSVNKVSVIKIVVHYTGRMLLNFKVLRKALSGQC